MYRLIPLFAILFLPFQAAADLLNFENLPDMQSVTTQFPGLTFSNTIILTAEISLNEADFPPHSGANVASDDGGPIQIFFGRPTLFFSGYFTYVAPLTLQAFDTGGNLVASAASAFSDNDVSFGDPGSSPNEFLNLSYAGGISRLLIEGDSAGSSFMMDDVSFSSVPEPSSLLLLLTMLPAALLWRRSHL
jgi:hypothetical protein